MRPIILALFVLHASSAPQPSTPVYSYTIVKTYPHSTANYTEGLFYLDGKFYEGTGRAGQSAALAYDPETGKVLRRAAMSSEYFGEGIIDWGPYLYQWTWQSHVGFVYDRATFKLVKRFTYSGEGWGMTRTGKEIITSDGTATLRFRNPETFKETRHILVKDGATEIDQLNELEFIRGEIYANIWHSDRLARISPKDGHVIAWIDLTGLLPGNLKTDAESVLNGIAYDPKGDRLFVTGKQWPAIFEIKLVAPSSHN